MAVFDLVQYERGFPLDLKHPKTRKPIGVKFEIMHTDCAAATAVVDRNSMSLGDRKSDSELQMEVYAACIKSWDWGEQEFQDGKGVLELTPENALHVLKSSPWITRQVMVVLHDIGNFTND